MAETLQAPLGGGPPRDRARAVGTASPQPSGQRGGHIQAAAVPAGAGPAARRLSVAATLPTEQKAPLGRVCDATGRTIGKQRLSVSQSQPSEAVGRSVPEAAGATGGFVRPPGPAESATPSRIPSAAATEDRTTESPALLGAADSSVSSQPPPQQPQPESSGAQPVTEEEVRARICHDAQARSRYLMRLSTLRLGFDKMYDISVERSFNFQDCYTGETLRLEPPRTLRRGSEAEELAGVRFTPDAVQLHCRKAVEYLDTSVLSGIASCCTFHDLTATPPG